jgi:hypothetical protein
MAQLAGDPVFLTEAKTAYGPSMRIFPGERMQKAMADALAAPESTRAALHALVLTGLETSSR